MLGNELSEFLYNAIKDYIKKNKNTLENVSVKLKPDPMFPKTKSVWLYIDSIPVILDGHTWSGS